MDSYRSKCLTQAFDDVLHQENSHLVFMVVCEHELGENEEEVSMVRLSHPPIVDCTPQQRDLIRAVSELLEISFGKPVHKNDQL